MGAALLCLAAAASSDLEALVRAAAGLAGLWTAYLVLALLQPSAMGFGDVKLAGLLGMHLGYLGWPKLVVGGAGAYVLGAPLALALLLTRRAGRGTPLPFGPLMLLGAGVGVGFGDDVVGAYAAALTS